MRADEILPLSLRAHEALRQSGLTMLSSILRLTEADLTAALGAEARTEIKALDKIRGLALRN